MRTMLAGPATATWSGPGLLVYPVAAGLSPRSSRARLTMDVIRIVLVDDNDRYRTSLASLLAQDGTVSVIAEAASGAKALVLVGQLRPDLVLVDVVMPGMSGIELTRELKTLSLPPRIIVLTMHTAPAYRSAAFAAGADDFLAKDEVTATLAVAIRRLFPTRSPATCVSPDAAGSPSPQGDPA